MVDRFDDLICVSLEEILAIQLDGAILLELVVQSALALNVLFFRQIFASH